MQKIKDTKNHKVVASIKKAVTERYIQSSDNTWFRGLIQSLNIPGFHITGMDVSEVVSFGQLMDTFIFAKAEEIKRKRLEQSLTSFGDRLKKLENNSLLDVHYIEQNIEQYSNLFVQYLSKSTHEYRRELREKYQNLIVNLSSKRYSGTQNKEFYFNIITSLTPEHFAILRGSIEHLTDNPGTIHENSKTLTEHLKKKFTESGMDKALILAIVKDLVGKGLMNESYTALMGGTMYNLYVSEAGRVVNKLVDEE